MNAASRTSYVMGASAPQHRSLQQLLAIADEDEINSWQDFSLGYTPSQGSEDLRDAIASQYPGLSADNIVVFAGAMEAIYVANHALLQVGDRMQVVTPIYEPLTILAEAIGAEVTRLKMQLTARQWQLDVDEWVNTLRSDSRLAVINFPHNPTGAMISKLQLQAMINACRENDCWLFSDEVFRGLEYQDADRLPPVASEYEKGISLGVMSKAFGFGGVRIGWIACQDKALLKRLMEIKNFLSICNGRADEILTMIALQHTEQLRAETRKLLISNLQLIQDKAKEMAIHIQWHQPQAGCIAYPKLLSHGDTSEFAEQLLDDMGILVTPGECFLQATDCFRLGFGRNDFSVAFERFLTYLG